MFAEEGLDVAIELYEGVDEVTNRLRDGRAQLGYGITEHVVLDSEACGFLEIIGGNVNRLPFSLIAGKTIRTLGARKCPTSSLPRSLSIAVGRRRIRA
jgi:hypothetical protein